MRLHPWQDFHLVRRAILLSLCAGLGAYHGSTRLGLLGAGMGAALGAVVGIALDEMLP